MASKVVVAGGGYGGIMAARALDDVADVTLVEPRETFFHNVGGVPSDYLHGSLAAARQPDGRVAVTEHLRVAGHERVFAIGDLTNLPEMKMARAAAQHGEVAAANIRALIEGGPLTVYEPLPDGIVLPLGPSGGVTYDAGMGLHGAETTAEIKATFHIERFRETLGLPAAIR